MNYPKELVGIRGLAATYILFRHSLSSLPSSFVGTLLDNTYGVKLFMIVSGFSIFWLLDTRPTSYGRFITGRFFRVFPVYLVGVVVYAVMLGFTIETFEAAPTSPLNATRLTLLYNAHDHFAAHLFAHLTLLHGLIPEAVLPYATWTLLAQAWSLTVEWQLYLIAPFCVAWLSSIEKWTSQIALIGLVAALVIIGRWLSAGFLGNNLAMFSIGLVSYMLAKKAASGESSGSLRAYMAALLILIAIWDANSLPPVVVWVATFYALLKIDRHVVAETISRGLRSRPLAYLGRISYSFYIFHMISVFLCLRAIDLMGTPASLRYVLLPATAFVLTVLLAEAAFRSIERPFHRLGKSLTGRRAPEMAAPRFLDATPLKA